MGKRELARLAKVRYATVIEIEKGRTARIDLAVLGRLARVLSVCAGACSSGATEEALAEVAELQWRVSRLETALREANENIVEANGYIEQIEAMQYATCDDLRFAASSVSTVNEVDEP